MFFGTQCIILLANIILSFSDLELYFGSATAAAAALESLRTMREGIEVEISQPGPITDHPTVGECQAVFCIGVIYAYCSVTHGE